MSIPDELFDPLEPTVLEAANLALREQNDDYRGLLEAASRLLTEIRPAVHLPFNTEVRIDEWLRRVARR
jgi:hypothetical protein